VDELELTYIACTQARSFSHAVVGPRALGSACGEMGIRFVRSKP
jgi:hypothetical protein